MKQKILSNTILFTLIIITSLVFIYSKDVTSTFLLSITIWKENIFPSLFIFFIICELLSKYGFINILNFILKPLNKYIFHLSSNSSFILITSMLSGFPSSAFYIQNFLNEEKISLKEAEKLILITHFPNPLFVINTIGLMFLNNIKYGYIILLSIILGNLIISFLIKTPKYPNKNIKTKPPESFIKTLINAIYSSFKTSILLLGIISCFLIITTLIKKLFNLNIYYQTFLSGLLEITGGIKNAETLPIPILPKLLIITFFICFGGLSIHMQIFSLLETKIIKYHKYLLIRLLHALISCFITYLLFKIF